MKSSYLKLKLAQLATTKTYDLYRVQHHDCTVQYLRYNAALSVAMKYTEKF